MRGRLPVLVAILGVVLVALGGAAVLRSDRFGEWAWNITGEESSWEALKGVAALAVLDASGATLELEPYGPVDHVGATQYGVNTFLQLEADPENVRRSMAVMRDAGIGWARQQFPWEDIEIHARGDFEDRRNEPPRSAWDKYDRIVDAATDHGVELLVRLDDPPNWAYASEEPVDHLGPPDDLEAYGDFVAAVVGRYCGRVRYYQIWNEPNIYPEWGDADVDPAGYAELVKIAAQRARAACDDVVIVSAALAPTTERGGRNMSDLDYLEALYEAGWADDYDVLAVNAFGLWTGPTDRRVSADRTNFSRAMLARDIQVRHGDADKPVWITEMGWDSPPTDMDAPYGRVDEETRARYTEVAYQRMADEWPWSGPGFLWFLRRPNWDWHERPEGYFRIVEPDWSETPTYQAVAGIANRPPILKRGRHQPDDAALRYAGPWRDVPPSGLVDGRIGSVGAEVSFTMDGTGFAVDLLAEDGAAPDLFLVVDDEAGAVALDDYVGGAALDGDEGDAAADEEATVAQDAEGDAAPDDEGVVAPDAGAVAPDAGADAGRITLERDGLGAGEHLVILRVDGGQAWLDEIRVTAPEPASAMRDVWAAVRVCLGAVVLVAVAAVVLLWARTRSDDGA